MAPQWVTRALSSRGAVLRRGLRRRGPMVAMLVGMLAATAATTHSTSSAFTATTGNSANSAGSGTVTITDDDGGTAIFTTLTAAVPGNAETRCVTVTYSGALAASVRLRATTTGTGLGSYLTLKITRGSFGTPPGAGSCTGFTADSSNYSGYGPGVLYNGALAAFGSSWAAGTVDPSTTTSPTAEVWTTGEKHAYKLELTLADDDAAAGKTATPAFTWEARDASATGSGSYYANAVLADGPSSFWRLDETSGTTAADTKNAVNATYQNGVVLNVAGPLRDGAGAVSFDRADDAVNAGNVYGFSGTSAFSVEFWVNPSAATAQYPALVGKSTSGGLGWSMYLNSTSYTGNDMVFARGNSTSTDYASGGVLTAGAWSHVVATYDGADIRMYVNGSLTSTTPSTRSLAANTDPLLIGWQMGGRMADVAIYTSALTQAQVQAHFNAKN